MSKETFQKDDGCWYWWDECWAFENGPYPTKEEAERARREYCKNELVGIMKKKRVTCKRCRKTKQYKIGKSY